MVQVKKEHYIKEGYHSLERFIAYYSQIQLAFEYSKGGGNILEIGVGNHTVNDYLRKFNLSITTCDFDENLKPDIVGDVRILPIDDNQYDVVMAFEVLEHIPFDEFEKALIEMRRVSRKYVILSLPMYGCSLDFAIRGWHRPSFRKIFINFGLAIPFFWKDFQKDRNGFGEHYWEIGVRNISNKRIAKIFKSTGFKMVKKSHPVLEKTTVFFVLEKF